MGTSAQEVMPLAERFRRFPELQDTKFFHEYASRLKSGRDMHTIVTAASETGVGKTTLAVSLAIMLDPWGWTAEQGTLDPREYEVMYASVRPGSWLILDEIQAAADSRRATSKANVNLSQAFAQNRYRQVFGAMTAPSKGWADDRIGEDSADYWIQAQETPEGEPKGEAKVYRLKNNEHYDQSYSKRVETISWPVLDGHAQFQRLHEKKVDRRENERESNYVPREEYEQLQSNYWNKCMKQTRFHIVRALADTTDMSQRKIARVLDVAEDMSSGDVEGCSHSWVGEMIRANDFEDFYG